MDSERTRVPLTDADVERVLTGRLPEGADDVRPDVEALQAFVRGLRSSRTHCPPPPDAALTAVFAHGLAADLPPPPEWAAAPDAECLPDRSPRVLAAARAVLGTVTAKVVLGAAFAVVSVSGAYAAGVIEVPRVPDRGHTVDHLSDQDRADTRAPVVRRPRTDHTAPDTPSGQHVDAGRASDRAKRGEPQRAPADRGRRRPEKAREQSRALHERQDRAAAPAEPAEPAQSRDVRKGPQR
jgi:hypothetical protein